MNLPIQIEDNCKVIITEHYDRAPMDGDEAVYTGKAKGLSKAAKQLKNGKYWVRIHPADMNEQYLTILLKAKNKQLHLDWPH